MRLTPTLPSDWQTYGYLYDSPDQRGLGEDMFEAELADGTLIAAGWSSENDPNGEYVVTVTKGLAFVEPPFTTRSMIDANRYLETTAAKLSAPIPQKIGGVIHDSLILFTIPGSAIRRSAAVSNSERLELETVDA